MYRLRRRVRKFCMQETRRRTRLLRRRNAAAGLRRPHISIRATAWEIAHSYSSRSPWTWQFSRSEVRLSTPHLSMQALSQRKPSLPAKYKSSIYYHFPSSIPLSLYLSRTRRDYCPSSRTSLLSQVQPWFSSATSTLQRRKSGVKKYLRSRSVYIAPPTHAHCSYRPRPLS